MNESSISIFIVQAALALFTFFVAAPCVLNAISTFTVQARLAKTMVEEGVITEADRRLLQPKKQIAGVVISVILVGALVAVAARTAPYGFFSCGIAAIAGVLLCSYSPVLQPTTGAMPGIKAFDAAVFGGIGSIPGAFVGGILIGIIEAMAQAYISTSLANSIVFGVLIIVLLVKPAGLLGKYVPEKV